MSKTLKTLSQIAFTLVVGSALIWWQFHDVTGDDLDEIRNAFRTADYSWIGLSMFFALLSHVFRAYRWKYPLDSLNLKVDMPNRFMAVMLGYFVNLVLPRVGEVLRCASVARYKKMPFEKLFGTVIAERLVDMIFLLLLIITAILVQFDTLRGWFMDVMGQVMTDLQGKIMLSAVAVIGLIVLFVGWRFLQRSTHPIALKLREKVTGLIEGFASIRRMKGQFGFYLNTVLIWGCYVIMYLVTFQCLPDTEHVSIGGVLTSFVLGGLAIVVVPGGFGAYPLAVASILLLYGVPENTGKAFGWIVWSGQTLLIALLGLASAIIMPIINRKKTEELEAA